MMKWLARALVWSSVLVLASCATPGFDRAWKQSLSAGPAGGAEVTGPWIGEWLSGANGHTGKLRCLVEQKDEDTFAFRYWATWGGWMKGSFRVDGDIRPRADGGYAVDGSKRLGPWGTSSHEGVIAPDRLEASFRSKRSNLGTFRMERQDGY